MRNSVPTRAADTRSRARSGMAAKLREADCRDAVCSKIPVRYIQRRPGLLRAAQKINAKLRAMGVQLGMLSG